MDLKVTMMNDLILLSYAGVVTDLSGHYTCEVVCSILRFFQPFIELWVNH